MQTWSHILTGDWEHDTEDRTGVRSRVVESEASTTWTPPDICQAKKRGECSGRDMLHAHTGQLDRSSAEPHVSTKFTPKSTEEQKEKNMLASTLATYFTKNLCFSNNNCQVSTYYKVIFH
jgi:hypothetical protein